MIKCSIKVMIGGQRIRYSGLFASTFDARDDADAKFPGNNWIVTGPAA